MQDPSHRNFLPSYGRRRGRKLKVSRGALVETLLPQLLINLNSDFRFQNSGRPLWVEIGFGGGEHLVEQARRHPEINFIGCEPYVNGMASLLAAIDKHKLTNIGLYDGDGRVLLEKLADNLVERLFVLFPDPWPKVRHHKRRIISKESLTLFYAKLKPGGLLRLATDHEDYCAWMLEQLLAFGKLVWTAEDATGWGIPPPDWVGTRYQAKAAAEGREPTFLDWKKPPF